MKKYLLLFLVFCVQYLNAQTFSEVLRPALMDGVTDGAVGIWEANGDNKYDVLVTGWTGEKRIAKLHVNNGSGRYIVLEDTPFEGVSAGSVTPLDLEDDGDQDVLITGLNNNGIGITKLYVNNGDGEYIELINTPFDGVYESSATANDVELDGDIDIFITGINNAGVRIAKLYLNDGAGTFNEASDNVFEGVAESSVLFLDVYLNGYVDILVTGINNAGVRITKLYLNDGAGTFSETANTIFDGVSESAIAVADVDGDYDLDVLITGLNNSASPITKYEEI